MIQKITNFKKETFGYVIGIDPDVDKSGLAILEKRSRRLAVNTLKFPELMEALWALKEKFDKESVPVLVVMESGYLNKGNWHLGRADTKAVAAAKGVSVGRNHQTGYLIAAMCRHYGMIVEEARPLPKGWKGREGKITRAELEYFAGPVGRTNQEGRDAALMAWVHAGLPIKVKV